MTTELLLSLIEKAKKGIGIEGSNLDLKWKWWDMRSELDEFLKDVCSMANTPSGDSYIIVGLKENGATQDAPLPDNEAHIQSKHKDKIEPRIPIKLAEFDVGGKTLSVVTIPHSLNRPHVIKKWRGRDNYIPIRVGSSTLAASRSDLDEMYQERYQSKSPSLSLELVEEEVRWDNYAEYGGPSFFACLKVDNYDGQASDYITNVTLAETGGNHWHSKHFKFEGLGLDQPLEVAAREIKPHVLVYISDTPPEGLRNPRGRPSVGRSRFVLRVSTRSGSQVDIKIKAGGVQ